MNEAEQMISALAEALDFSLQSGDGRSSQQQLLDYLSQKEMLFLFDSFEHLLGGAGFLADFGHFAAAIEFAVRAGDLPSTPKAARLLIWWSAWQVHLYISQSDDIGHEDVYQPLLKPSLDLSGCAILADVDSRVPDTNVGCPACGYESVVEPGTV